METNTSLPLSDSLGFKLHRAAVLADQAADMFLRNHFSISYSLFSVLIIAGTIPTPNQHQIARALGVSRASVTQRIARLLEQGLVTTSPDERDGRAHIVYLTERGGTLLEAAWRAMESDEQGIDRNVDTTTLMRELDTLIANALSRIERVRAGGT